MGAIDPAGVPKNKIIRVSQQGAAANQGQPNAQQVLGFFYEGRYAALGDSPVKPNLPVAYIWHSLAVSNGHRNPVVYRDLLARKMTPAQIAEAERLVKEWKANSKSCEVADAPASSSTS